MKNGIAPMVLAPSSSITVHHRYDRPVLTDDGAVLAVAYICPPVSLGTFLLVHGWGASREAWAGVSERLLEAGYSVVAFDHRGHGASSMGQEGISIDRLGRDVATVVAAVQMPNLVIAGHSGGGYAVLSAIEAGLDLGRGHIEAVGLISTAAHGQQIPPPERKLMGSGLLTKITANPGLGAKLLAHTCGPDAAPEVIDRVREQFTNTPASVRGACFGSTGDMDLRAVQARIGVPVAVVVGDADGVIKPDFSAELAEAIPNATLTRIAGAGHQLPIEVPDRIASALVALAARTNAP